MNNSIFPQVLYVVEEYHVYEVKLVREYNLLRCARYETYFRQFDVMASDISKTAFHSKRNAWKHVELKVRALTEWVEMELKFANDETPAQ